jgi:uncharacterized membrane protein
MLVLNRDRIERGTVALLLDASASMNRTDHYDDQQRAELESLLNPQFTTSPTTAPAASADQSRARLLTRALVYDDAAALRQLAADNTLAIYRFADRASGVRSVAAPADVPPAIEQIEALRPDGQATNIAAAVQSVFGDLRGRRLAAVIIASDGRNTLPVDTAQIAERALGGRIPIHTVRIGSTAPRRDITVGPLKAEQTVFIRDLLSIQARVVATGFEKPASVKVTLREDGVQTVLAEQTVSLPPNGAAAQVELRTKPTYAGRRLYRVEVVPLAEEVETANNTDMIEVNVLDTRLRLLYVEGYPRYEYRYVKNTLLREETVTASCLLLSADEGFAQEGNEPIRRFPETPEELDRYDVVLLGDVDPRGDWITEPQQNMLLDFVSKQGGGFGLIAGQRNAPHRFRGTPLEKLLPVLIDPNFTGRYEGTLTDGFQLNLTPEGKSSPIFRFEQDPDENLKTLNALPSLYWLCRTQGPRPGAEVLADHPSLQTLHGPMPVVVVSRYGAGKLFFQAIDDTWRWRRHGGEPFFDAYWLQVARFLTRSKLLGQDRRFTLETDRREYDFGQPALLRLTVFDTQLDASLPETIDARITDADRRPVRSLTLSRLADQSRWYEGSFIPPNEGSFFISLDLPPSMLAENPPTVPLSVRRAAIEDRVVEADHQFLEQLAANTGGQSVFLPEMVSLAAGIGDHSVRLPDDLTEPLWDTKLVLVIFVLIITAEWILRKAFGMI